MCQPCPQALVCGLRAWELQRCVRGHGNCQVYGMGVLDSKGNTCSIPGWLIYSDIEENEF